MMCVSAGQRGGPRKGGDDDEHRAYEPATVDGVGGVPAVAEHPSITYSSQVHVACEATS
jgi:hypothetical protein